MASFIHCVVLLVPLVTVYATSMLVGGIQGDAGAGVVARPPAWAFGVVWPVLCLALGSSWVMSALCGIDHLDMFTFTATCTEQARREWVDIPYGALVSLLCFWMVVYTNGPGTGQDRKRYSLWVLVVTLACLLAVFAVALGRSVIGGVLLAPLISWIVFATMLSVVELQIGAGENQLQLNL